MHLHAPGVVSFHLQERLMFSPWQCLTSESFLLSPAWLHCREMQGNLMGPQPLALILLPHQCRQEKGICFTAAAAALEKNCEKNATFFIGKKKKSILSQIRSSMFLNAKKLNRD